MKVEVETNVSDTTLGYSGKSTDGTSFEVKKETTQEFDVHGAPNSDAVLHDNDRFYLWVNAEIDLSLDSSNNVTQNVHTINGEPIQVVDVSAKELKNRSLLPQYKTDELKNLKDSDYAAILSMDPFMSNGVLDPARFQQVDTLQLEGPDLPNDPLTGLGLEVDAEQTSGTISGFEQTVSVSLLFGGAVSFGIVSKVMAGVDLEWSFETTNEWTSGQEQKVEVILATNTVRPASLVPSVTKPASRSRISSSSSRFQTSHCGASGPMLTASIVSSAFPLGRRQSSSGESRSSQRSIPRVQERSSISPCIRERLPRSGNRDRLCSKGQPRLSATNADPASGAAHESSHAILLRSQLSYSPDGGITSKMGAPRQAKRPGRRSASLVGTARSV